MRESRVVVTFHTTTEAMAWERACKQAGLPGRLIAMPVQISAECGLVWLITPQDREDFLGHAKRLRLGYKDVVELE